MSYQFGLERVTQAQHNATVAAVSRPLVEEVGAGDGSVRDSEVASISHVEHVGAELHPVALEHGGVLQYDEVEVLNAVCPHDVTPRIPYALPDLRRPSL